MHKIAEGKTPLRRIHVSYSGVSATATAVVLTAAATTVVTESAAIAAAAEQQNEDNDPPAAAKTIRTTIHNQEPPVKVMSTGLTPYYDRGRNW